MSLEYADRRALQKRFPSARARLIADRTVDALDPNSPMMVYIDVWLAAYRAAAGREPKVSED